MGCAEQFSCLVVCDKILSCSNHRCKKVCHEGPCEACPNELKEGETCHCQKYSVRDILKRERRSCIEEIPSCAEMCDKICRCGHRCIKICHKGECDCGRTKTVSCGCGEKEYKTKCNNFEDFKCLTICNRKKNCTNHICKQVCCPGKKLQA